MNGVLSAVAQPRQGGPRELRQLEVGGEVELSSLSAGGRGHRGREVRGGGGRCERVKEVEAELSQGLRPSELVGREPGHTALKGGGWPQLEAVRPQPWPSVPGRSQPLGVPYL